MDLKSIECAIVNEVYAAGMGKGPGKLVLAFKTGTGTKNFDRDKKSDSQLDCGT